MRVSFIHVKYCHRKKSTFYKCIHSLDNPRIVRERGKSV